MVWIETPTNPTMKVIDIEAVAKLAHSYNKDIIVVVDNTFLTSYFQRPLELGADIVVYSLSKYMNGHSDVIMGAAIINDEKLYKELLFLQNASGIVPSPFDCYQVNRSLKTLAIRMEQHQKSSIIVANYLEAHPKVERVLHPGECGITIFVDSLFCWLVLSCMDFLKPISSSLRLNRFFLCVIHRTAITSTTCNSIEANIWPQWHHVILFERNFERISSIFAETENIHVG